MVRDRKFHINKYVLAALKVLGDSPNVGNLTLNSVCGVYDRLADESMGEKLSKKCVHKHLDSDKSYYVDKTPLIKTLFKRGTSAVTLITRPVSSAKRWP